MTLKTLYIPMLALLLVASSFVNGAALHAGSVTKVSLDQIHPTQPAIGYDQVYYKLGRFKKDPKKLFDEICEVNGQKGLAHFDKSSKPNDPTSFECKDKVGTYPKDMKTIVIAPNNQYYLTDGHHTFNSFWQMQGGGAHFKVNVLVAKDYRNLANMQQFWSAMRKDGNTWLENNKGQPITYQQLPTSLGMKNFENDKYRSMMYFSRGIAWKKPQHPIPFLEFYWAKDLRKDVDLNKYNLKTEKGYRQAIMAISHAILDIKSSNVGGSGQSAKAMGQLASFHEKAFKKLFKAKKGKIAYMLAYKNSL
ncbi:ParB/Srx family N-terminal domain-containing protein [Marinomonas spartinae]|uniref:ParB/Srx family N-terminal domain-containing protein n=1 Tax=Marinomonas spartinae TaxID=1792290 RepID=UPI0018F1D257|nr:ParB/Srx family N-terminal domain-containing protein [Marinomonas spartinae]MBJ7553407.1 ParB/Srx family N-terminal domain-containing protein [Marinomonas spartinae]